MNVSRVSESLTVIELTPSEVESYSLSFSQEDYSSAKYRMTLWEIIAKAQEISGKTIEISSDLEIDFMPDIKGGCLMLVSETVFEEEEKSIYQTENTDNLLDFAAACRLSGEKSYLYKNGNCYRLIVEGASQEDIADEFCLESLSSRAEESTKEYFECVLEENALEILSGLFLKQGDGFFRVGTAEDG